MMQRSGVWNANEVRWSLVFWASTYIFFMKVSSKQMCTAKGNSLWNLTSNSPVMSGLCWQHTLIEQFWPFVGPVLLEIFDPRGSHTVSRVALLFLVEDRALLSQSRTESPKDRAVDELRCHCSSSRDDAVTNWIWRRRCWHLRPHLWLSHHPYVKRLHRYLLLVVAHLRNIIGP